MHIFQPLLSSIVILVIIAAVAIFAKRRGLLDEKMAGSLSRIVLDIAIPAMIFVNLANTKIEFKEIEGPAILTGVEIIIIFLACIIGKQFGLTRSQLGAVVLCSVFGTTATLGYSIIAIVYPKDVNAMTEAVLISEIGGGMMVLTLGSLLARYFGAENVSIRTLGKTLVDFLKTPICIALVAGLIWGASGLPGEENPLMRPVFRTGHLLAGLVVPLSIFTISLKLKRPNIQPLLKPFGIVVVLKLLLCPLLVGAVAIAFDVSIVWRDELIIMAGLPPAVLSTILLQRYGGDATLASILTAGASLLSLVTLLLVIAIAG